MYDDDTTRTTGKSVCDVCAMNKKIVRDDVLYTLLR